MYLLNVFFLLHTVVSADRGNIVTLEIQKLLKEKKELGESFGRFEIASHLVSSCTAVSHAAGSAPNKFGSDSEQ